MRLIKRATLLKIEPKKNPFVKMKGRMLEITILTAYTKQLTGLKYALPFSFVFILGKN